MTKQEIEAVLDRVRTWPPERQAYAAYILVAVERDSERVYELSDEENQALDEAEASGVASHADVRRILDRYRA